MNARPLTERCARALAEKTHAVIGISPFNSYFSEQRIQALARWGLGTFEQLHLFVPDVPSAWTLEALGYGTAKARQKARRQANWLRNKILRALSGLGLAPEIAEAMIIDWASLQANPKYVAGLERCEQLFEDDADFRAACVDTSRWVLQGRVPKGGEVTEAGLLLAARYFLAELPLFAASTVIFEQTTSVFCYHQVPSFLEGMYRGEQALPVCPHQGFVVVRDKVASAA